MLGRLHTTGSLVPALMAGHGAHLTQPQPPLPLHSARPVHVVSGEMHNYAAAPSLQQEQPSGDRAIMRVCVDVFSVLAALGAEESSPRALLGALVEELPEADPSGIQIRLQRGTTEPGMELLSALE